MTSKLNNFLTSISFKEIDQISTLEIDKDGYVWFKTGDLFHEYRDKDNKLKVKYTDGKSVTPGQACVIYLNDECLMGGIIEKVYKSNEPLWYLK